MEDLSKHKMDAEYFKIDEDACRIINTAKQKVEENEQYQMEDETNALVQMNCTKEELEILLKVQTNNK